MFLLTCMMNLASCNSENYCDDVIPETSFSKQMDKTTAKAKFAEILSKATFDRQDVRQFLKNEALKQFDKNYDVLYIKIKDSKIGDKTFKQILDSYASEGELDQIEACVPTINIYLPNIPMLGLSPIDMDCEDAEIPVVLPGKESNSLLLNGEIVENVKKGELPGFHTFVVNENTRVAPSTKSRVSEEQFVFVDPVFDNSIKSSNIQSRTEATDAARIGSRAIEAYSYFNRDDNSNQSKALQRDYIYYGMTPTSTQGSLNYNVSDYLCYIEVEPKTYSVFTDFREDYPGSNDPEVQQNVASKEKHDFTEQELIDIFWTRGQYDIKLEIESVRGLTVKYVPVKPEEIWNFNYDRTYVHRTMFRHSKYTYTIDTDNFTVKRYYLPNDIVIGKWNLSNESLTRKITFIECDPGETYTFTSLFETSKTNTTKVNGSTKYGLGKWSIEGGIDNSSSTTDKVNCQTSITRTNNDDLLGSVEIDFYDPVIVSNSGNNYILKDYYTGYIHFGITAK